MALLPRSYLKEFFRSVHCQSDKNDCLLLVLPITQILIYYETKIRRKVDIVDDGIHFTLFINAAIVLNLYEAIAISMHSVEKTVMGISMSLNLIL